MNNFISLNLKDSTTSLEYVDQNIKFFRTAKNNVIIPVRVCQTCGVPESITKLYDGICEDCAKHYTNNY